MAEKLSMPKHSQEKPTPSRPLFFSPKAREKNQETEERAERLGKTMGNKEVLFKQNEIGGLEDLVGNDDFITLKDFFQIAEEASQQGDRSKLVALKRMGQKLLNDTYAVGEDKGRQAEMWGEMKPGSKSRLWIRAAEMIVLKAEMEYLKLRMKEGTLDDIPSSQRETLMRQFRRYERNVDLPEDFRKELRGAAAGWRALPTASRGEEESSVRVTDEPEEAQVGKATLAKKSSAEETQTDLKKPVKPKKVYWRGMDAKTRKQIKQAGAELEIAKDGVPEKMIWKYLGPETMSQAVEWCVARGTLSDTYWVTAQMEIKNALQALGLLDTYSTSFTHNQLVQQLQYALHRNQWRRLGYWGFWGGIDWLNQLQTKADVAGVGWGAVLKPRKVLGEEAAKALRQVRDVVAQGARRAAETLANSGQPLSREHKVVQALLELIADELEAVSAFEERKLKEQEEARVRKKERRKAQKAAPEQKSGWWQKLLLGVGRVFPEKAGARAVLEGLDDSGNEWKETIEVGQELTLRGSAKVMHIQVAAINKSQETISYVDLNNPSLGTITVQLETLIAQLGYFATNIEVS